MNCDIATQTSTITIQVHPTFYATTNRRHSVIPVADILYPIKLAIHRHALNEFKIQTEHLRTNIFEQAECHERRKGWQTFGKKSWSEEEGRRNLKRKLDSEELRSIVTRETDNENVRKLTHMSIENYLHLFPILQG